MPWQVLTTPPCHRHFHWDVANAAEVVRGHLNEIKDQVRRDLVAGLLTRFERETLPHLATLRRAVIHGDANDYNVLVGGDGDLYSHNQRVAGLLDFGDMVYSCLACEPAIAAAYALLDKPDPLAAVAQVVTGYHSAFPLAEEELAALWDLVCMRLCMSVCHAAHQRRLAPENDYLSISEIAAWQALARASGHSPAAGPLHPAERVRAAGLPSQHSSGGFPPPPQRRFCQRRRCRPAPRSCAVRLTCPLAAS